MLEGGLGTRGFALAVGDDRPVVLAVRYAEIPALAVDPMGRYVVVANYIGGDFVVLPIEPDGRVGPVSGVLKDVGAGPNRASE